MIRLLKMGKYVFLFFSSSRAHAPMIAVGSDDSSPNAMAKVQIFEYNENTRSVLLWLSYCSELHLIFLNVIYLFVNSIMHCLPYLLISYDMLSSLFW